MKSAVLTAGMPSVDMLASYDCLNSVVVAVVREDGRLVRCNKGFRRLLQLRDDTTSRAVDDFSVADFSVADFSVADFFVAPNFDQLVRSPAEPDQPIYRGVLNVGNRTQACRSLIGRVYRKGRQLILVAEYDVAEMERLNAKVTQLNEQMAEAQRQQARIERRLRQAKEAAEAASRAKNEFLANMSHELRSPLNTILGFARIIARAPALPEAIRADLGLILKSGEHLHKLINDVLDLSKLESGRATLNETDFDLDFLLDELENMLMPAAIDKGLRLVFEARQGVPRYVRADPLKLRQVLLNLIGNALKFTERGRVTVRVEPLGPVAAKGTARVAFTVTDTGIGIARDELTTLFGVFAQAKAGRAAQEGTGLGLALSRRFVQLMGGEITLDSEIGHGTTVRFEIPLRAVAPPAESETIGAPRVVAIAPGQTRYRLLVVDDHAEARELLVQMLAPLGFELQEAADGQAAIDRWREWQPNLIWMDLRMPVLDGREAARRIRAADQGQQPVIIALTASCFEEERADVLAAGCDDLLRKPFREEDLFALLEKHLRVRFIYQMEAAAPPLLSLDANALASLPEPLRAALERATQRLDVAAVERTIDAVRACDVRIADALAMWAGEFQYDEILSALHSTAERTR
jgi:signal transduction histidine kinase/CheY-like chemotaxis protein